MTADGCSVFDKNIPNVGSLPTISINSPQTRKTPIAAAWCCHLLTRNVKSLILSRGLLWKLMVTTLMMIPHWTQFSQLRKYNFWLCINWKTSFADNIRVDIIKNTHTMIVDQVILEYWRVIIWKFHLQFWNFSSIKTQYT